MGSGGHGTARIFLRFSTSFTVASGALVLLGWLPTSNLGGSSGIRAMLAGCGVSLGAALVGVLPALRSRREDHATQQVVSLLGGMTLRMAVALGLTLILVLGTDIARTPFVIWVGISYLALLPVDLYWNLRPPHPKPGHG